MKNKRSLLLASIAAYILYLVTMVKLPGLLDHLINSDWPRMIGHKFARKMSDTTLLYFCLGHMAVFGAIIPLIIAKKFDLKPHRKVSGTILWSSVAVLIGAFMFYAHDQGFLPNMLNPDPDPAYMTEAFLHLPTIAGAVCLLVLPAAPCNHASHGSEQIFTDP